MKNKFNLLVVTVVAALFFAPQTASAQAFDEGESFVSLGIGFPNMKKAWLKALSIGSNDVKVTGMAPIHLKFEYGLTETWGIGATVNYAGAKSKWDYETTDNNGKAVTYAESFSTSSINFLVRINKHYLDHDKVDFYTGFGIGYNHSTYKYKSEDPNDVDDAESLTAAANIFPIGYEATIGLRYMFSDNIGAYLEAGWAKSLLQFGATMKF